MDILYKSPFKRFVKKNNPAEDMLPVALEDKIICFADKFYSKKEHSLEREKSVP